MCMFIISCVVTHWSFCAYAIRCCILLYCYSFSASLHSVLGRTPAIERLWQCDSHCTITFHIKQMQLGTHRGRANLLITYPESVAPTAISGNNESNAESKISMNR